MKMVVIFGPGAVGKMTVGQQLSDLTGFPLLHNHMTIELLLKLFPYGSPSFLRLNDLFREELISELSKSDHPGIIFTYLWALDHDPDREHLDRLISRFTRNINDVCFTELCADQPTRLARNKTENRLSEKPSKHNLEWSDQNLRDMDEQYVLNTSEDLPFFYPERHLKIDNTRLEARIVAEEIKNHFGL